MSPTRQFYDREHDLAELNKLLAQAKISARMTVLTGAQAGGQNLAFAGTCRAREGAKIRILFCGQEVGSIALLGIPARDQAIVSRCSGYRRNSFIQGYFSTALKDSSKRALYADRG